MRAELECEGAVVCMEDLDAVVGGVGHHNHAGQRHGRRQQAKGGGRGPAELPVGGAEPAELEVEGAVACVEDLDAVVGGVGDRDPQAVGGVRDRVGIVEQAVGGA